MFPLSYRKKKKIVFGLGLLLLALCLGMFCTHQTREALWNGLRAALGSKGLLRTALFLQTGLLPEREDKADPNDFSALSLEAMAPLETVGREGQPVDPSAADGQPDTLPTETEAAELRPEPPVSSPPDFTDSEAEAICLRGDCSYGVDKAVLLRKPLGWQDRPGPKVLILHSHTCESYTQSEGHSYISSADYRTLDMQNNVVAVGDALAQALAALGVELIHDRTFNDYPDYNRSYAVAREKIQSYLEQYPSIVMVLDLHRDALETPLRETVELEGQTLAPLMLVIGTDEGGLEHPNWADNLSCGLKLQALASREQPELFKSISFRKQRFNGDLTGGSLIVEVGSTENTLPEATAAMPYLARYVAQRLTCP